MRVFIAAAALCVTVLAAAPGFAQATPPQAPPAAQAPAPTPAAAPAPPAFPAGTKYAYINIQRIAGESAEGKAATTKVQALNQQKVNELQERNKALQAAQQKFDASATVMSDPARAQLQKEIERLQIDLQRFTEDAQQDVAGLQQELQEEFERRLLPIINEVAAERGLHLLFSASDAGLVWADPSLDITAEVIQKFDAASKTAPAPAR